MSRYYCIGIRYYSGIISINLFKIMVILVGRDAKVII